MEALITEIDELTATLDTWREVANSTIRERDAALNRGLSEDSDESLDLRDDWEKLVEENAALNRNLVRHREAIRRLAEERHLAQRVADEITQIVKDVEGTP